MRFAVTLLILAVTTVARAQTPFPQALSQPPVPTPPAQGPIYEPTLYCLYNGLPYSRGSRLYQGGFAMSCDMVPANPTSLVWQLIR